MDQEEKFFNSEAEEKLNDANELFLSGKANEAEKLFREVTRDFPEFFPGWLAYGDFFLSLGKPSFALRPLRKAVSLVPSDGAAYFGIAIAMMKIGRFYFAQKALETAAVFIPGNPEIIRTQGYAQIMLGNLKKGRELLREAISADPFNGLAYCDLAHSYAMECDFDESLRWLEIARNLDSENKFIAENIRECKKMREDFLVLSTKKREEKRRLLSQRKYRNEMRIQLLMRGLAESSGTKEDLYEVIEELKQTGMSGQIAMFKNLKSRESREIFAYIQEHKKIKNIDIRLSVRDIRSLGRKLFDRGTNLRIKKQILIKLAHQTTKEALNFLEFYYKKPDPKIKSWAKMAYEECKSFLEDGESGRSAARIHKIKES